MSFDSDQFKSLIERTLEDFDPKLADPVAVKLLMGTCAQESAFGTYLRQKGGGPALGVFQIESFTFNDIRERYKDKYPQLAGRSPKELEGDICLGIVIARLKYRDDPHPLPADDVAELAQVWKRCYNAGGKGTISEFVANWRRHIDPYS